MMDYSAIIQAAANVAISDLSDDELVTLNLVAALDTDPRQTQCWPNAEPLFTELVGGVPRLHAETKRAIAAAVNRRIG
jgi:hypothetical protein